jgi:hypothetical protein
MQKEERVQLMKKKKKLNLPVKMKSKLQKLNLIQLNMFM